MSRLIPQNDCDNCKVSKYCGDKDHVINCFIKTDLEIMAEQIRADVIDEFANELIKTSNYERFDFDDCLDSSDKANDFFKYVFSIAEQLKEYK